MSQLQARNNSQLKGKLLLDSCLLDERNRAPDSARCHPERSDCFASRSNRGVEGPLSANMRREVWCWVVIPETAETSVEPIGVLRLRRVIRKRTTGLRSG